jgi:autotransporter-associated beta strand protein
MNRLLWKNGAEPWSRVGAMRRIVALLALGWAMAALWINAALAVPSGYHLAFDDEFNGTSLADTQFGYIWTGYPGADFTSDAVSVGGGSLTLTSYSTYDGSGNLVKNFGGAVSTQGSSSDRQFAYGYYEARILFHNAGTNNPAFWLECDNRLRSGPATLGNEVDILEHVDYQPNVLNANMYFGDDTSVANHTNAYRGTWGTTSTSGQWHYRPTTTDMGVTPLEDNWHTYGLLWTPTGYTAWVDGHLAWTETNTAAISNSPEYVVFDNAPDNHGPSVFNFGSLTTSVTKISVDYFRYYQSSPLAWNSGAGGSGTWNSGNTNWTLIDGSGGNVAWPSPSDAYFRGTGGTVTIAGLTPSVNSLNFEANNYTIAGGSLTLASSGVRVAQGLTATIASSLNGSLGLLLSGNGKLILSGNNTYSGPTTVNQGSELNIRSASALGTTGGVNDGTRVNRYATLQIQGGITTAAEPLSMNGFGFYYNGELESVSGNNTYSGPIWIDGNDSSTWIAADSGSTLTLSNTITGSTTGLWFIGNGNTIVNGAINIGSGELRADKWGGKLTLTAANNYTGPTTIIDSSVINIQNGGALGGTATGTVVNSGCTLELQGGISVAEPLTLGTAGAAGGTLWNISGSNIYTGPITLASDSRINSDGGTLTINSGTITGSGYNLYIGGAGSTTIASVIATGSLTKDGSGMLTLTTSNTYTGPTTVSAGTLKVANATGSATGSGTVTVGAGATLAGSGVIGGPVTIAGALAPGSSPGILTVNNRVTFQPGATFSAEVFGLITGNGYDQLTTTGPVSLTGSLALTFGSFTPTGHDILIIVNNTGTGATTGMFQYADNAKIGRFDGFDWYITYDANNAGTPSLNGGNDVAIYSAAVPEPSVLILLGIGAISLLAYAWRRN